ncbi:uncharacterized protein BDR25DRAFT_234784 [Lindgomyces ingoldianus]|uniref:Uncharacterized protein n=1 Tax=Lindgomyces ingoldianus TaxID=673940 RepID=A0ACB6QKC3_9PLEO|nr:uncharacterized protein BDR25DRAFT_234784 [Lindgomyces ingoldianus]KAF2467355.1 hypothetical protein BDR25DRAFT_234784 [Lindgomyces ingoldianus]
MLSLLRSSCLKQARPLLAHFHSLRTISTSTIITTPAQLPKIIITPGSAHHNSLPSFLEYANRVNLSPSKTVYVGTHYEYVAALSLLRLGFSLLRTGRKSDAGIDLIGHWILPQLPEPLPVIVQCKARSCGLAPKHVRELEGAFQGTPAEWRKKDVLGLLVTTQKATRGVLEALGMNRWPMGFVKVSRTGTVEQFLWNRKNGKKRRRNAGQYKDAGARKDIQLTWMGEPIFPDREGLDEETMRLGDEITREDDVVEVKKIGKTKSKVKAIKKSVGKKTVLKKATELPANTRKGRSPGSLSKKTLTTAAEVPSRRGRPKGSKNKTKK